MALRSTALGLNGAVAAPYGFLQGVGPSAFVFVPQQGIALSSLNVTSNVVALTGINSSSPLTVTLSGDASAEYSKNGGAWSTGSTTAVNGDQFQLRVDASSSYNTTVQAILTVDEVVGIFLVTTLRSPAAAAQGRHLTRLHWRR